MRLRKWSGHSDRDGPGREGAMELSAASELAGGRLGTPIHGVSMGSIVERRRSPTATPSLASWSLAHSPWQWVLVGAISLFLGLFALAVWRFPSPYSTLLLVAVLGCFAAVILGNVRQLVLAAILLDAPLQLGMHLGYDEEVAALGATGGLSISVTTILLPVLYALWFADVLTKKRRTGRELPARLRWSPILAVYVGVIILSLSTASDVSLWFYESFIAVQTYLLFVYIASTVRSREQVVFVTSVLIAGLALQGLIMLATQVLGREIDVAGISSRIDYTAGSVGWFHRVGGTLGTPNGAAAYLSLLIAPALALLVASVGRAQRWLASVAVCLALPALLFTFSRGGWLAFVLSAIVFCSLAWRRGWLPRWLPLVAGLALPAMALLFQDAVVTRVEDDSAALGRLPLITIAFRMIAASPAIGIGANNFAVAMYDYVTPELSGVWLYLVHNRYLLIAAETGLAGLAAFLLFLFSTLWFGWRAWKGPDRLVAMLALSFTAGIIGHMFHMMVDILNHRPYVQVLWVIAALLLVMGELNSVRSSADRPVVTGDR